MSKYLSLAVIVVILDQATKWLAVKYIQPFDAISVTPFLNFVMVHNKGAAFGFLNQAGGWQQVFFISVAVAVSVFIIVSLKSLVRTNTQAALGLTLIMGGAIGNVIDRVVQGYVVDFIDFYVSTWHFWAFNIADSAISIGAILVLLDAFGMNFLKSFDTDSEAASCAKPS